MTIPQPLRKGIRWSLFLLALAASAVGVSVPARAIRESSFEQQNLQSLPAPEFSRLIQTLSEKDGYFRSDNFTSNETSYLHVVGKLRELGISGGAYVGVGPEQNFTYIAKIRPHIAFIVDIRRQAVLQHLLYKALFHISESRAEFLSALISRPLTGDSAPGTGAPVERILAFLASAAAPETTFTANLTRVRKIIGEEFGVPLSEHDQDRLGYVYSTFHKEGLEIAFGSGGTNWGSGFPNLRDLILQPDLSGKPGNFLATEEDYQFVRDLQLRNLIIPVVGDFAGPKALASVGEYLRKNGYTVSAFYTSNVERFLFQNDVFKAFAGNVRKLPIAANSVFIRSVSGRGEAHPAHVPGHRTTTVLQKISVFLRDYDQGAYADYRSFVSTNFIAGTKRNSDH
jgi:hypothetical protein